MVYVLLENNLGYKTVYFGGIKTVFDNAIQYAVALFKFFQEHCHKLIRDQKIRFGSPILRGVWKTICTKKKQSGKTQNWIMRFLALRWNKLKAYPWLSEFVSKEELYRWTKIRRIYFRIVRRCCWYHWLLFKSTSIYQWSQHI